MKMPKKLVDYLKPLFIRVRHTPERARERIPEYPQNALNSRSTKLTSHRNLYKALGIGTKIISKAARSSAWSRVKGGRVSSTLDKWKRFCHILSVTKADTKKSFRFKPRSYGREPSAIVTNAPPVAIIGVPILA